MLIKEHWGIENAPFYHYCLLEKRIPSNNCKIFVTETRENTHQTKVNTLYRTKTDFLSLI